eukprot:snap_masked-scaffold893_size84343-processed-gene-0.11 protein:Tk04550 transcript:snap_masked-scaffold893_size84343-processed-gene-0.11-mRNA-1 annotation:"tollip-like protein"
MATGGDKDLSAKGTSGGYTSLQEENASLSSKKSEEEDFKAQEWEERLLAGDLPEDFLQVTEPQGRLGAMATNSAYEPEVGNLVDVGGDSGAVPRAAQGTTEPAVKSTKHQNPSKPLAQEESPKALSSEEQDRAMALALQEQLNMEDNEAFAAHQAGAGFNQPGARGQTMVAPANMIGKLTVTVVEAKLAKNYGMSRMDPYCRVRVGHSVFESPTCPNGSKEPKWNKTFYCYLLQGIKNIDIEIFDECTFYQDSLVAHGSFPIPEEVMKRHEVVDEWLPLSGNEGAGKEGMIHVILSLQPIPPGQPMAPPVRVAHNVAAGHKPLVYQTTSQERNPRPEPPQLSVEELEEFVKMFPNLDKDIIASVFAACQGDKEATVNNLLQLGQS